MPGFGDTTHWVLKTLQLPLMECYSSKQLSLVIGDSKPPPHQLQDLGEHTCSTASMAYKPA